MKESILFELRSLNNQIFRSLQAYCIPAELKESFPQTMNSKGLSHVQCFVMDYLYDHRTEEVYQKDVETRLEVARSTVTNIVAGMEAKGIVLRESVEKDARLKKIKLSPMGIKMREQMNQSRINFEERLMTNISEEEIGQFVSTLHKIEENLKEEKK